MDTNLTLIASFEAEFRKAKRAAERAIEQVADADLHARLNPLQNSIAAILQHMAGNMRSRWTDFLTTDGNKPDRDREAEFADRGLSRGELLEQWNAAWAIAFNSIGVLQDADLSRVITIRTEPHTVQQALLRSLTHAAGHTAQIVLIAKHYVGNRWQYLTVPPGGSDAYNRSMGVPAAPRDTR